MRTCIVCGAEIGSKRKDAKFCRKAACRAKEYRRRQEEAAKAPTQGHVHQASALLTCPCGRRFLLQFSMQDAANLGGTPTLTPMTSAESRHESPAGQSALPHLLPQASSGESVATSALTNCSELIVPDSAKATTPTPSDFQPPVTTTSGSTAAAMPARPVQLRTLELYFTNHHDEQIPFWDAVRGRGGFWSVRIHAKAAIGLARSEGAGLGGTPGRWRSYYKYREPSEFGHETDLAVLYWDDGEQRACVAEVALLKAIFGAGWKEKLRELCDGTADARKR